MTTIQQRLRKSADTRHTISLDKHGASKALVILKAKDAKLYDAADLIDELVVVLDGIKTRIEDSEEWWMDVPTRGGFDLGEIDNILIKAKGKT